MIKATKVQYTYLDFLNNINDYTHIILTDALQIRISPELDHLITINNWKIRRKREYGEIMNTFPPFRCHISHPSLCSSGQP